VNDTKTALSFEQRVEQLFAEYSEIPVTEMGLPVDWKNHPLWKI